MLKARSKENLISMLGLLGVILLFTLALVAKPVQAGVLWDQPLSVVNQSAYVNQNFPDFPAYSSFLADDFANATPWNISKIFVPGDLWSGGTTLGNATYLNFAIYGNDAGIPAGYPGGGSGPQWNISLTPTDLQITISTGSPGGYLSNVTLNLATAVNLPVGEWWFIFYPVMDFTSSGQYGRQPSDTTNGNTGQFINPGGGFGYGTDWQPWTVLGATQSDIAFRMEGTTGQAPVPEPATMLLLGSGLIGLAGYGRKKFFKK